MSLPSIFLTQAFGFCLSLLPFSSAACYFLSLFSMYILLLGSSFIIYLVSALNHCPLFATHSLFRVCLLSSFTCFCLVSVSAFYQALSSIFASSQATALWLFVTVSAFCLLSSLSSFCLLFLPSTSGFCHCLLPSPPLYTTALCLLFATSAYCLCLLPLPPTSTFLPLHSASAFFISASNLWLLSRFYVNPTDHIRLQKLSI